VKTAYLNVLIILLATSISGCSEDSGATITVTEASSIDEGEGFCGYGDDEECHSFVVSIANSGSEDFSTNMFYWDAVSDDGGVYSTPDVDGPDAIAGGATTSITLHFDVSNGVKLTTLKYQEWSTTLEASIPSYDLVISFNVTLTVDDSSSADEGEGFCGSSDDEECHFFNITVVNDGLVDFSNNMYNWEATGDDGGTYDTPSREGPDEVPAGSTAVVMLFFDVPNGVKLTTLHWEDYSNSIEGVSIPPY
tara:strand:+ start:174 stop:923 length:750 start_codon:yes stop_codon:yes gene_type:complete